MRRPGERTLAMIKHMPLSQRSGGDSKKVLMTGGEAEARVEADPQMEGGQYISAIIVAEKVI